MNADVNIAATGALLADPTRAQILLLLLDGRALPAGELARRARVSPSTASAHLTKLLEGGLLAVERQGRHRYFRLAQPSVGKALEALASISPPVAVRSLRESQVGQAIHFARTCYDHLAGKLGVGLTESLVKSGTLCETENSFELSPAGADRLTAFGLDLPQLRRQRRAFAPRCLDWSERRHHVAGSLGAALVTRLFDLGWVRRTDASRAVQLTDTGRQGLANTFQLELER